MNDTKTIGIITNDHLQVFQRDCIVGVTQIAEDQGYQVIVDSLIRVSDHFPSLDISQLAGIVVIANVLTPSQLAQLRQTGIPMTLISHHEQGLPIPSVIPNNRDGIRRLVDYVVTACGCREIVFIKGDMQQHDGVEREQSFHQSLLRHQLIVKPEYLLKGDFSAQIAANSMRELIAYDRGFDAVIASDYLMAVAVLNVLREAGVQVPEDVCVVGYGDGPEADEAGLTTIAADIIELGRRSARLLFGQIEGLSIRGVTWLSTAIVERETANGAPAK